MINFLNSRLLPADQHTSHLFLADCLVVFCWPIAWWSFAGWPRVVAWRSTAVTAMSLAAFDEVNLKGESLSALFFFFFSIWCFTANPQPQTCHHRHQDTIGLPLRYGSEQPKIKSTEPPACPFACSLALLTYSLASHCSPHSLGLRAPLRSFVHSLTHSHPSSWWDVFASGCFES